jgi:hypothetical protein
MNTVAWLPGQGLRYAGNGHSTAPRQPLKRHGDFYHGCALGFLAHWAYFIHGERDLQAANIARVHLLIAFIIPYIMNSFLKIPIKEAIYESIKISVCQG